MSMTGSHTRFHTEACSLQSPLRIDVACANSCASEHVLVKNSMSARGLSCLIYVEWSVGKQARKIFRSSITMSYRVATFVLNHPLSCTDFIFLLAARQTSWSWFFLIWLSNDGSENGFYSFLAVLESIRGRLSDGRDERSVELWTIWLSRASIMWLKFMERLPIMGLPADEQSAPVRAAWSNSSDVLVSICRWCNTDKPRCRFTLASSLPATKHVTFISATCPEARCWTVRVAVHALAKVNNATSSLFRRTTFSLARWFAVRLPLAITIATSSFYREIRFSSLSSLQGLLHQGFARPPDDVAITGKGS